MLKAHALAYHIYDNEFRKEQKGQIGFSNPCSYPFSKNKNDFETVDVAFEFQCGWTGNPVYSKEGDYPEIMKKRIAERSRAQGYNESRLPTFSKHWVEFIRYKKSMR